MLRGIRDQLTKVGGCDNEEFKNKFKILKDNMTKLNKEVYLFNLGRKKGKVFIELNTLERLMQDI